MNRVRRDARFTAGPYEGMYLVAENDDADSIIAFICEGHPKSLNIIADYWFEDVADMEAAMSEDGWAVEWLPNGALGPVQGD